MRSAEPTHELEPRSNETFWELKTSISEFERIVKIGLGRAIVVLQQADPSPYRDVVLNACLHDLAYDQQVEGSRAPYVFDLIRYSGGPAFYRAAILAELKTAEDRDLQQLFDLVVLFARDGDEGARAALYDRFAVNAAVGSSDFHEYAEGAEQIVQLDGIHGFLFVAERFGVRAQSVKDFYDDGYLLRLTEERDGVDIVQQETTRARRENPAIARYLEIVERVEADRPAPKRTNIWDLGYDLLKLQIERTEGRPAAYPLSRWGQSASAGDLERAACDLLAAKKQDSLPSYLSIFRRRPFPFGPEPLIRFATSGSDEIAGAAMDALVHFQHPSVRRLAVDALSASSRAYRAVDLLAKNYHADDHLLILRALRVESDEFRYHSLGFRALRVLEANLTAETAPVLLTLYETGPCSQCRRRCFDLLRRLDALPGWMVAECLWDSNDDLRDRAREILR